LPSLRERREDIPLLIHHFLQIFGDDGKLQSIPETTMKAMQRYDWPGNVRELQNAVRQFIALQEMDVISNLPLHPPVGALFEKAVVQELGNGHSLS
jgi:DNA-binding NtrC family response regulator